MIKFADYFNFADIKSYDEICMGLASGHNFLATNPVNLANKSSGPIERAGDLFYGIINNEPYPITVKIYLNERILETLKIPSGQTGYLSHPLIMIKLYRTNKLTYQITSLSTEPDKTNELNSGYRLGKWIGQWFSSPVQPNYTNPNVEFIYGYLTEQIRKDIMSKKLYCLNNVDAWNQISLYGHTGHIESWLYTICYMYPEQVNRDFCEKYLAVQFKNEEVIPQFINLNPDWVGFL